MTRTDGEDGLRLDGSQADDSGADERRWQAVRQRDRALDGQFVYAVRSTGIYCRPSCSARTPRRANVSFHATPALAEAAGYRACRRCHPQQPDPHASLMDAMAHYIARHAETDLPLAALAAQAGLSPAHFQRAFKARLGLSPRAYQAGVRAALFRQRLRAGDDVTTASHAAGYGSSSRVHAASDRRLGMTPSAYRAGGAGETVHWAVRETLLGWLLMAATARGVCSVAFGDSAAALEAGLAQEFPQARRLPASVDAQPMLDGWIAALEAHLAGTGLAPALPLDLRGTVFQQRVWQFLTTVPRGTVVTYSALAAAIGAPAAVRAAASACAANRIAVLVPCHRALRADGGLGGYRWGVERKRRLLADEGATITG